MRVSAYLARQGTKFHVTGWTCWFLRHFILTCVSGLMRFRNESDKGTPSNVLQISEKLRQGPWNWLENHWWKKAWAVHRKSKLTETEKGETSEEHAHSFLHQWDCYKNSSWQVKQSISYTTVTFYGDCVKICEDFARTLATNVLAVASRQRTSSHFFLTK
jgi:hypothetical protein